MEEIDEVQEKKYDELKARIEELTKEISALKDGHALPDGGGLDEREGV